MTTLDTNYAAMVKRIKAANKEDILKIEQSLDRLYSVGIFTTREFSRLDAKIMDRLNQLGEIL